MKNTSKTIRPECGRMGETVDEYWLTAGIGVDSGHFTPHPVSHETPANAPHTVDS